MAAGLGFKDFVTGEVLTAADVDGYLMQGIWVFASNAARDAAVTAPAEGNFAFTKDTNSLWYYDGAAWVASGATGDIEGVTAGTGISGGGTSGTVTITNSMATAIDAKGDLIGGTGADTFARLAIGTNGQVLTADSAETTGLKWATPAGGSSTFVGCSLYKSTQSVPNATYTALTFDSELYDTNGFHNNSTNNTRITIPSGKAGYYEVAFANPLGANTTGDRIYHIYKNGSLISEHGGTPSAVYPVHEGKQNLLLAAGDYLELYFYQASGSSMNITYSSTGGYFSVAFLGA
jgi:hypothetical protein